MNKRHNSFPEIVDKDESEIKRIIEVIKASTLPEEIKSFVIKCIELALWLPLYLQNKAISLHRLRVMVFGKGYGGKNNQNKTNTQDEPNKSSSDTDSDSSVASADVAATTEQSLGQIEQNQQTTMPNVTPEKSGHGRMPSSVYNECDVVDVELLLSLTAGDDCPELCGGTLRRYKPTAGAGIIIRIKGQNFARIYRYNVHKLRCDLCNIIIKADIPPDVGKEKYDASFKAMLAIMKYYVAIPFYRQENLQRMLKFPLSDSTQWHLIEILAGYCYAVFNQLKRYAANGKVVQHDDTTLKILEIIKQIKAGNNDRGTRVGMYTTGIIAAYEEYKIALFINGIQHSGENIDDILDLRALDKDPIIQMCDALSANNPKKNKTTVANCLSHGYRKFYDVKDFFAPECLFIMEKLSLVFGNDADSRAMNDQLRLEYHQQHSKPIMDELHKYMTNLMDKCKVEPNSELGKAIKYMLKHWSKLTRFLTVAGAPIDNNIVERALKIAIRNRKAAMFYRTVYSAGIGGMLTSLIYTCDLAKQNPHDYLIALQVHQDKVVSNPEQWMPWNYLKTIAAHQMNASIQHDCTSDQVNVANPPVHSPPQGYLAVA